MSVFCALNMDRCDPFLLGAFCREGARVEFEDCRDTDGLPDEFEDLDDGISVSHYSESMKGSFEGRPQLQ